MDAFDGFVRHQFFGHQAGCDRRSGASVVRKHETKSGLPDHVEVGGFNVAGRGSDAREANCKLAAVFVSKTHPRGHQKADPLDVGRVSPGSGIDSLTAEGCGFVGRNDGLVRRSIGKPDSALVAGADPADRLQGHWLDKMTRQRYSLGDRKVVIAHFRPGAVAGVSPAGHCPCLLHGTPAVAIVPDPPPVEGYCPPFAAAGQDRSRRRPFLRIR